MIQHNTYRDGGTQEFISRDFTENGEELTVTLDNAIGTSTRGKWYIGMKSKGGKLMTKEEEDFIIPKILKYLKEKADRSLNLFESIRDTSYKHSYLYKFELDYSLSRSNSSIVEGKRQFEMVYKDKYGGSLIHNNEGYVILNSYGQEVDRGKDLEEYIKVRYNYYLN
jgi:hypothetical protein